MKLSSNKRFATLLLALTLPFLAYAEGEFGIWSGVTVEKKLPKKWWKNADDFSVNGAVSYRVGENLKQSTRIDASVGVDYKLTKYLKLGAGYIYIHDYKRGEMKNMEYKNNNDGIAELDEYKFDNGYWRNRHRGLFEATGKIKAGRFTFSLRERYQFTYFVPDQCVRDKYKWSDLDSDGKKETWVKNEAGDPNSDWPRIDKKKAKHDHVLRSRLKIDYDIKGCPLAPFVSYEVTNALRDKMRLEKHRVSAGLDWKINKKHKLSFAYLLNAPVGDKYQEHVLDIGYKFDF